ncbi:hypothetical protein BCR43DRAFT_126380 [Syncephalastrum racemosum]|uniref:Uncharacterized protein n=1 Tax=Syncephalastrum racemosum TaxID=13706 RepID=A0A1X2HKV7_SYNRA|nr:hypothetical protein BCR43DRAFT_126380 [Syncephalastrum racemosum]
MIFDRRSVQASATPPAEFSSPGFYPLDASHGPLLKLLSTHSLLPFESQSNHPQQQQQQQHQQMGHPPPTFPYFQYPQQQQQQQMMFQQGMPLYGMPNMAHIPAQIMPFLMPQLYQQQQQQQQQQHQQQNFVNRQGSYTRRKPVQLQDPSSSATSSPIPQRQSSGSNSHRIQRKPATNATAPIISQQTQKRVRFSKKEPEEYLYPPEIPTDEEEEEEDDDEQIYGNYGYEYDYEDPDDADEYDDFVQDETPSSRYYRQPPPSSRYYYGEDGVAYMYRPRPRPRPVAHPPMDEVHFYQRQQHPPGRRPSTHRPHDLAYRRKWALR